MPNVLPRLSHRAEVNWLLRSNVMTAGMPFLAIQPSIKTTAQAFAEISDNRRASNHLVFRSMIVNT
jgi:hypothetical protein